MNDNPPARASVAPQSVAPQSVAPQSVVSASVVALTAGLALAAVALVAIADTKVPPSSATRWAAVPLFGLLVIAGTLRVRYHYRGETEAVDVLEAVLAPALLLFPAVMVVPMVAAAKAVAQAALRIHPAKAAFNVAQWSAAAGAGCAIIALAGPGGSLGRRLAVLAGAIVVVMIVNHVAVVTVLRLVGRQSFALVVRGLAPIVVAGWLAAGLLNLGLGLLLAAAATTSPWLTPLALAPLAALYWAGRHLLVARLDRDRGDCFRRATDALAEAGDPNVGLGGFLAAVTDCFAASVGELLIEDPEGLQVHRVGPSPQRRYSSRRMPAPADPSVSDLLTLPDAAFVPATAGPRGAISRSIGTGRRPCLAAPIRLADRRAVMCVYEPQAFGERLDADITTLKVLAGEAVHAFGRAALNVTLLEEQRRVEQLLAGQGEVFESVARGGNLTSTLRALAALLEEAVPGSRATIVLDAVPGEASPVPVPMVAGSGPPTWPDDVMRAARDAPTAGGSATVFVVEDMHRTGYWEGQEAWHGLRAWWVLPVLHPQLGTTVGVVAVAHPQARAPEPAEREMLAGAARLARLAFDRTLSEARLAHQARHDSLTGLANREAFLDATERALRARTAGSRRVLVLFVDLDRFKFVNDSFGHELGDRLLVEVARRIESTVRPTDLTARLGGDEFAVLCQDLSVEDGLTVAARVLAALDVPVSIARAEVVVTASIGLASTTGDVSSQTLIERADAAMYRAKEGGRNCIVVFDEDMRNETRDRLAIRASLHRALERGEMRVHYQPMVSVAGGHTVGVEALARWRQPDGQLVGPAVFIEAAEESGLIIPLGALVLEEACRQAARWRAAGRAPLTVSVNLSARQVADIGLVGEVARVLVETGIDPASLILEITESVLMEAAASTKTLQRLKGLGVGLAIDDFGTGYSSLSYLKRFPVDSLKVDRSFVEGLGHDAEDTAIVAAVINLAHTLGLGAVAEGVETGEQLRSLQELGCEVAQGYHLGRPVPAEAVLLNR